MNSETWSIDSAHTYIGFTARHMVITKVRGKFNRWQGTVDLDLADPTRADAHVVIEAASIDTGIADRDAHLRSPDFFDVERFPTLTFQSTRIVADGPQRYRLTGALTIRDITRDVTLEVEYLGEGRDPDGFQRAGFNLRGQLDRKDFGLRWNQVLETGGVLVGDRVELGIEIQLVRQQASQAA